MKIITKKILVLSLVSMFTDISTEMLYPVMPIFLKSIGYSVFFIGILEGVAEAVAGYGKGYFGKMSDSMGKRVPFVRFGYFLSAISKPMMILILNPFWILFSRASDRIGKGIRTGARDAILSSETTKEFKGRVFGFHRTFDTFGAALGPIIALIYLHFYPGNFIPLFYMAIIPGLISVMFTFYLKEPESSVKTKTEYNLLAFLKYWKVSAPQYKRLVIGLLAFALVNSSDVFLLLIARHNGADDRLVIILYIFYNLVYAVSSGPLGILGDKIGLKKTFIIGLGCFVITYAGLPFAGSFTAMLPLFFIHGVYAAATEGISKAWLSNIAKKEEVATAIGFYTSWQSLFTFIASAFAGLLWSTAGASAPFIMTAGATIIIIFYLIVAVKE